MLSRLLFKAGWAAFMAVARPHLTLAVTEIEIWAEAKASEEPDPVDRRLFMWIAKTAWTVRVEVLPDPDSGSPP